MSTGASELLELAIRAATEAGLELSRRQAGLRQVTTKSSATDVVTDADHAAEALLVNHLLGARPDDGLVGEEGHLVDGTSGLRWVIDPLDGTVNYVYGYPAWCVSVACEDGSSSPGEALLGVVYDPLRAEVFSAVRGQGARLGSQALEVNDPVDLGMALIATGFSYEAAHRAGQADFLAQVLRRVRDVRRGGSAALDLCSVAAGRVDGYYEDSTAHWDWAAGALIAREAGAAVTLLGAQSADAQSAGERTGVFAAGPALHAALLDLF